MFRNILALITGFTSLFICLTALAEEVTSTTTTTNPATGTTTVVEKKVIVTPAPKSVNCTTVAAHWEDNVWVADQTVCKYEGRSEGAEWVQDYWACTVFTASGDCTTWEYRPGHWIQSR